jgi:ankyrin repeat protein
MDKKFKPAVDAIKSGDVGALKGLLDRNPSLATERSRHSHPTLLQFLVLEGADFPNKIEMAKALIDAGAGINGSVVAAASINNVELAKLLLDRGAAINGVGSGGRNWSPLEEALYWNNRGAIDLLLERGASLHNLRIAAGMGRLDLVESFFDSDGSLKPEAGEIDWPFGELEKSDSNLEVSKEIQAKAARWSHDRQSVIDNAFVYACMHNHIPVARLLLQKGAKIDAIPPGFDYSGTGLHYAALNGHRAMVEFLVEQGASTSVKDTKVNSTPAGWAAHAGHEQLKQYLEDQATSKH